MRYWHPFTSEAIAQLREAYCDELVLLPLYPQYSSTTTGSSLNEWRRLFCDDVPVHCVEAFYGIDVPRRRHREGGPGALSLPHPEPYRNCFQRAQRPTSVVEKGDPYQRQIEDTVRLLMDRGGWGNRHRLCYQSKVGASRWLQPSLHQTLHDLRRKARARFVSCRSRLFPIMSKLWAKSIMRPANSCAGWASLNLK